MISLKFTFELMALLHHLLTGTDVIKPGSPLEEVSLGGVGVVGSTSSPDEHPYQSQPLVIKVIQREQ